VQVIKDMTGPLGNVGKTMEDAMGKISAATCVSPRGRERRIMLHSGSFVAAAATSGGHYWQACAILCC